MGYFLAIDIPDFVAEDLKVFSLPQDENIYHQRRADLHITLAYLGHIPDDKLDDFVDVLCDIEQGSFSLSGTGVTYFGPGARYRNHFYVAKIALTSQLQNLKDQIDKAAMQCDLTPKGHADGFNPHITLARSDQTISDADIQSFKDQNAEKKVPEFKVESFALYKSQHPRPYKKLCEFGLK